jgi:hypothetical protein
MCQFVIQMFCKFLHLQCTFVPMFFSSYRWLVAATFLCIVAVRVQGQDMPVRRLPNEVFREVKKEVKDTLPWRWKSGWQFNANLTQGSLTNWAAGGDNFSLSVNTYTNYYLLYKQGRLNWDNNVDFNFGYIQSTSLGSRKNDDRFDLLSKVGMMMDDNSKWFLSGLFNFRTQFFDGYTFAGSNTSFASTFLSPAYTLLSAGFDHKPNANLSVFLSPLTARWVIVMNETLARKGAYGVTPGRNIAQEIGAFASVNYRKEIMKNVTYRGRIDLFTNYLKNPENVDVFVTNLFTFKINKFLSATYNLDLIYDDDVRLFGPKNNSAALQVKSVLGVGFLLKPEPRRRFAAAPENLPDVGAFY